MSCCTSSRSSPHPERVAESLLTKYGDVFTRTGFYAPYPVPPGFWEPIVREVQAGVRARGNGNLRCN